MSDKTKVVFKTTPVFVAAALVLLILKLTAYPTISWWWIVGVFTFPILAFAIIFAIIFSIAMMVICGGGIVFAISYLLERKKS